MMFFLFLLLHNVFSEDDSEVLIGMSTCTCNETSGFCDASCSIETRKNQSLPDCSSEFLPKDTPLGLWLVKKFFCLYKDHRKDYFVQRFANKELKNIPDIYNPLSYAKDDVNQTIIEDEDVFSYGEVLKENSNKTFYIPSPFLATVKCQFYITPIEFLVPVDSLQCYYNISEPESFTYKIPPNIILKNKTEIKLHKDPKSDCSANNTLYKRIDIQFIYDKETRDIQEYNAYLECYNTTKQPNLEGYVPLQVDVHFYSERPNPQIMKSGDFGYSYGQPLIVSRDSYSPEPFPIPFGYSCTPNNIQYTPLKFGYDTISGCSTKVNESNYLKTILKRYTRISMLGQANGAAYDDWLELDPSEINESCQILRFNIDYEYIGNVNNPQPQIYSASYECSQLYPENPNENEDYFILVASFRRSGEEKTFRYIPKPKGLPNDTFAPLYEPD